VTSLSHVLDAAAGEGPGRRADEILEALADYVTVDDVYHSGAATYDAVVEGDTNEIRKIVAIARQLEGEVLDLGCGSGRVTLPLLARGHRVVAVENSADMLRVLLAGAAQLPARVASSLEVVEKDIQEIGQEVEFESRQFDAILLGSTTVSLLSRRDLARTFAFASSHLTVHGRFIASILKVDPARTSSEDVSVRAIRFPDGSRALVTMFSRLDAQQGTRAVDLLVQDVPGTGAPLRLYRSSPRLIDEQEIDSALLGAGLVVAERLVMDEVRRGEAVVMFVCQKAESARRQRRTRASAGFAS
jgi:SAM-dependent methyltransferase